MAKTTYSINPQKCINCDFHLPAITTRDGKARYPSLPNGECDQCRDYREQYSSQADWGEDSAFYSNQS